MSRGPQSSVRLAPSRAGQRLDNAGRLGQLVTVQPALNLIVTGVTATPVGQGVSLEVPPELSDCITVWLGYDPAAKGNNLPQTQYAPQPDWPLSAQNQATRRLFATIEWGAAGGRQVVEVDVSEGVGVTVPTATCEVYVYSETIALTVNGEAVDPAIEVQDWSVMVHAAPGRAAREARRTRQVVQPLVVPDFILPPNTPPSRPREVFATIDEINGRQLSLSEQSFVAYARRVLETAYGGKQ